MILAIENNVQPIIAQGKTRQDVLAAKVTAAYDAKLAGQHERERRPFRHRDVHGAEGWDVENERRGSAISATTLRARMKRGILEQTRFALGR